MSRERYESQPSYDTFQTNLVANLRLVRERAGMTQREFSIISQLGLSTVRKIENNGQKVSAYILKQYCEVCKVNPVDLLQITRSTKKTIAENTTLIDQINDGLQQLSLEDLKMIHDITQHLLARS